jgi:predicted acetyltransferase
MIRPSTRADIPELADLWARAFPDLRSVEQRIASLECGGVYGGVETAWLAEEGGRVTGAFRAYALTQNLHGAQLPMLGLAAVAVDETARRRGLGRRLCEEAIRIGRERGDVTSMLFPFRQAFYENLGWGTVGSLHAFRFRPESLRHYGGQGTVRRAAPDQVGAAGAVYDRFARRANGPIRRTQRAWRQHLEGDGGNLYVTGDAGVTGYAIVHFGRTGSPEERSMYIRELLADGREGYDALLGWVAAQRDAWRVVHYDASPDEKFEHRLLDPRTVGYSLHRLAWAPVARSVRGPMMRLLDVAGALQQRVHWGPARPMSFGLEVRDAIVPENDGSLVVDFDGDRASVRRGSARPLLRLPVAVLAQVHAGELGIKDALALGLAEHDGDVAAVDALFRSDRCFRLMDEF